MVVLLRRLPDSTPPITPPAAQLAYVDDDGVLEGDQTDNASSRQPRYSGGAPKVAPSLPARMPHLVMQ